MTPKFPHAGSPQALAGAARVWAGSGPRSKNSDGRRPPELHCEAYFMPDKAKAPRASASPASELTSVSQLSSQAWKANLPLLSQYPPRALTSPDTTVHPRPRPPPAPGLARALWHHQILPGRWGPWAKDGKAGPGGSGRKVPLGSFLCGPLGFLSGCHLPKVTALWGTGAGR